MIDLRSQETLPHSDERVEIGREVCVVWVVGCGSSGAVECTGYGSVPTVESLTFRGGRWRTGVYCGGNRRKC